MGAIEVARLGFRFPGGAQLLQDVSFRVGDGEKVALVGANGAGKTTLVRLLAGDESGATAVLPLPPVDETGGTGVLTIAARLGVMRQLVGSVCDAPTVRDLLVSLAPP